MKHGQDQVDVAIVSKSDGQEQVSCGQSSRINREDQLVKDLNQGKMTSG